MVRNGLRLHERTRVVSEAEHEFVKFFIALEEKYDLTYGEMYKLLGERITTLAKYEIRSERHPDDPDKKGDEA